jgi:ribonuclease P protein component
VVSKHSEQLPAKFTKSSRLLKHVDFDRVYRHGQRHFSSNMTVFFLKRTAPGPASGARLGFTVGRGLGGAVQRNRIRRRMREAARLNLRALKVPVDVVINPKKSALMADFQALRGEVREAFGAIARTATGEQKKK